VCSACGDGTHFNLDGIAWDWVSKKLYWTDYGDKDLEVYDPSSGHRKVLFQFGDMSRPRAIVLDPDTRYVFPQVLQCVLHKTTQTKLAV
jgi:hypothetical protein